MYVPFTSQAHATIHPRAIPTASDLGAGHWRLLRWARYRRDYATETPALQRRPGHGAALAVAHATCTITVPYNNTQNYGKGALGRNRDGRQFGPVLMIHQVKPGRENSDRRPLGYFDVLGLFSL